MEFGNKSFILALSTADTSSITLAGLSHPTSALMDTSRLCDQQNVDQVRKTPGVNSSVSPPAHFYLHSPLFSSKRGVFSWMTQSIENKISPSTAGPHDPFLTFREESAPAKWDLMLIVAQKLLNRCPNVAHLAVMTNRILFWKRGGKKTPAEVCINYKLNTV